MENQFKIMQKIPSLLHHLSGSCHSTTPSNVIESSIAINNTTFEATFPHHHQHHLPSKKTKKIDKPILISDSEFRRRFIRPVTSIESFSKRNSSNSSNNGGWFSSEENKDEDGDDHDDILDHKEGSFYSSSSLSSSQSFGREIIRNGVTGSNRRTTKTNRESCSSRRKTKNVPRRRVGWNFCEVSSTSSNDFDYYDCGSFRRKTVNSCRRTRKDKGKRSEKTGCSKIEESYAVEKDSNDPYRDFKISMVEMIAENEIAGEEELEKLLLCFLSLNSCCHHEIILDVFSEVCTTLFDDLVN